MKNVLHPQSECQPSHTDSFAIETYRNPILTSETENAWEKYGFGDPFVLRHNGVYYLYVSTKDRFPGIKCWSSLNLVDWQYKGMCATHPITTGAYAPEVCYYNGHFYLYTSPAGNGHYVLRSDSPTGPFEPITENMGMSIDGSVFIDNDGKWYFFTSGHGAITAYMMESPYKMNPIGQVWELSVNNGWSEGPMVVYHDGYYYMTYTGNHVLCKSYRINYAASDSSPLSYSYANKNPLLISTIDAIHGIGHSSTVKGPDLDSYYIVYHSLVNMTPNRSTNIDRIVFDHGNMEIMGPTVTPQEVPALPDLYARFDENGISDEWALYGNAKFENGLHLTQGSTVLSKKRLGDTYTAEYNILSIANGGVSGALFSYTDEQNFGSALFDPSKQVLLITFTVAGVAVTESVALIRSFEENVRFDCLQSLQIEKNDNTFTFYVNDRLLCARQSSLRGGSIGYIAKNADSTFGFIGATAAVGGRGSAKAFKSVSATNGLIPAVSCIEPAVTRIDKDSLYLLHAERENQFSYRILAAESGTYDLSLHYRSENDAALSVWIDGKECRKVKLSDSSVLVTEILRKISLDAGTHLLSLHLSEGIADFRKLEIVRSTSDFTAECTYSDGNWVETEEMLRMNTPTCGKRLYGNPNLGDYAVEAEITPLENLNCGLLVRTQNPGASNFKVRPCTDSDSLTGTDWFMGYFVGLTAEGIILSKHSYSFRKVAGKACKIESDRIYSLKAVCNGATVSVYLDGELQIRYTDPDPFVQGMFGVRTCQCSAVFEKLRILAI